MVGSAWSEREKKTSSGRDDAATSYNSDMMELSRQQRMNTDIRRNIFCTVMTSEVKFCVRIGFRYFNILRLL